eukprot:7388253-Prymnesium_polylepis.1
MHCSISSCPPRTRRRMQCSLSDSDEHIHYSTISFSPLRSREFVGQLDLPYPHNAHMLRGRVVELDVHHLKSGVKGGKV